MERNSNWGLGSSLLLHGFGLILLLFKPTPHHEPTPPPPLVTFIEVPPKSPIAPQKTGSKKGNTKKGNGFRHGDFAPESYQVGSFKEHSERQENGWAGNEVMETMNGMGLSEYSENFYFFEVLVGHLNNLIPYPKELWEHKIEGKIWVKVQIDRKGRLLRVIDTSKTTPVLMAFILVNLFQALKEPLPERYWYSEDKDLSLQMNFDYSVSSVPTMPEVQSARYFKNRFEFRRVAKVPNLIEETMRDYARYVPPIIPIPGGAMINFVQLYNMIKAWQEEDPLVQKRNRELLTRDRMQKLLEKSQKEHYP